MEIEFARGSDFTEASRMRLTYVEKQSAIHPAWRFPVIYHTCGNGTVERLELTDAEGKWLAEQLGRMLGRETDQSYEIRK